MPVTRAPADASTRKTLGSIGSIRSNATATYVSSTAGSLSPESAETHAVREPFWAAHWASRVVFP